MIPPRKKKTHGSEVRDGEGKEADYDSLDTDKLIKKAKKVKAMYKPANCEYNQIQELRLYSFQINSQSRNGSSQKLEPPKL